MESFWGSIEYINGREAIVTLFDSTGEWSGSGLVQCRSGGKSALYEQGYISASRCASWKGGRLDRFMETA